MRGTFEAKKCVYFYIKEKSKNNGLIGDFLQWGLDNDVYTMKGPGSAMGNGEASFCLTPKDAKKAEAWLEQQGLERK